MFRRRRPLLRAAAVGGVGYAAGKHAQRNAEADAERDARLDDLETQGQQPEGQQAPAAPAATTGDMIGQLERLGQLRDAGVLTDAEFEVQKQKILQGL